MSRIAILLIRLATRLLPAQLRHWGEAMEYEAVEIDRPGEALSFALGCLGGAVQARIETIGESAAVKSIQERSGWVVAASAIGATGCGLAYMSMAGAPARYLIVNSGALVLGFLVVGLLALAAPRVRIPAGAVLVALGAALLGTGMIGTHAGGATRWVAAGPLFIQPSLLILPVLAIGFARIRDLVSLIGIALAALALALQPDRAMAGALAAGMLALAITRPDRIVVTALAIATGAFAVTLVRPDTQPAMPHVDQILYTAFDVHPLAGLAVVGGSALLLVPAIFGILLDPARREVHAVFGGVWLAIVAAAALGNYPTPLVGYSGSAVIGYVLCLFALSGRTAVEAAGSVRARRPRKNARGPVSRVLSTP